MKTVKNLKIFLESCNYNKTEKIRARNKKYNIVDDDDWDSGSDNTDMDHHGDASLIEQLFNVFKK